MKKTLAFVLICAFMTTIFPMVGYAESAPSAPSINSYTAVSDTSIKIGWGKVSGATKYRVDRRRSDESDYRTLTKTCTSTSYTDSGLKSGSKYYYRVYAINGSGTSKRSVTYEAHTKPNAPAIASVNRDSDTQLTIKWNAVSGATKYKIMYRRGDQSDYQTLTSNVTGTSYTHKNLTSNAKYWYRVYAIRECDIGPEGNRIKKSVESARSETKGNFTKMSRPSSGMSNDNTDIVTLSWEKACGGNDYSYDIYRKGPYDSGFTKIKRTKDLTYTDVGLMPGCIYKYKINTVTTDTGDSCTWCDEFYAAPKITDEISLLPNDISSIRISWKKPVGANNLIYHIMKWNGNEYYELDKTFDTFYIDKNLTNGNEYRYYIQVRDSNDKSITSTYGKSVRLSAADLGTGFYASIMTSQSQLSLKADNGNVYLGDKAGTADTLWRFDRDSDGSYKISNTANGAVLDATGCGNDAGTNVGVYDAHDDETKTNQQWYLFEQSGGYVIIPSYNMGLVLDVSGGTMAAGTNIQLWTRNNSDAQLYKINKDNSIQMKAPSLNVQTGSVSEKTKFSWNSVPGAVNYKLTVYHTGQILIDEFVNGNEYYVQLPIDEYTAVITASNHFESKTSNNVSFNINCTHLYGEWQIKSEVNCTQDGERSRACQYCGNIETEIIPKWNHSYSEFINDATCTIDGEKYQKCQYCGDIKDKEIIPAYGHAYPDLWTTDKNASCTEDGHEFRQCLKCPDKQEHVIDALGHNYIIESDKPPTETEAGTREYKCERCGNKKTEQYVEEIPGGTVAVGTGNAVAGRQVVIPVMISDNPGIASFDITIDYDATALVPESVSNGSVLETKITSNLDEPGITTPDCITVNAQGGVRDSTLDGILFNITFNVKANTTNGAYNVSVRDGESTLPNSKGKHIVPTYYSGAVNVITGIMKGDIYLDGKIDANDGVLLAKHLACFPSIHLNEQQLKAADIYEDGIITSKDGVSLAQIRAGWQKPDITPKSRAQVSLAGSDVKIFAKNTLSSPGKYVEVPICIENNPGIAGFNFKINYDQSQLTPVSIRDGELLADGSTINDENGRVSVISNLLDREATPSSFDFVSAYWSDTDNISEDGTLFYISFLIADSASVDSNIPIEIQMDTNAVCNSSLDTISTLFEQGKIQINDGETPEIYKIVNASMLSNTGEAYQKIPSNGNFDLHITIEKVVEGNTSPADVIAAAYDENGCLISVTKNILGEDMCELHIDECNKDISEIKIFIWSSLSGMIALADSYIIN